MATLKNSLPPAPADAFGGEDPKTAILQKQDTPITNNLDLRDYVHYLVGKGISSSSQDPDYKGVLSGIASIKGVPFAQKLMSHIALFNQRPEIKGKTNPEDRINQFYNIGSSDPDIQSLITGFKGLGGKPVTNDSPLRGNIDMGMGMSVPSQTQKINQWKP